MGNMNITNLETLRARMQELKAERADLLGGISGRERWFPTGSKIHAETVDGNSVTRRTVMTLASHKTALFLCL